MSPEEFSVASHFLQDAQRVIAAGKVQRWEVVKWGVAVNLALAAAAASTQFGRWSWLLVLFSIFISGLGLFLIFSYNRRMTNQRNDAITIIKYLESNKVNVREVTKIDYDNVYSSGDHYDRRELCAHYAAVLCSIIPVCVVAARTL